MYGQQIGTLALLVNKEPLWSLSDRQEDQWLQADLVLPYGDYLVSRIGILIAVFLYLRHTR